MSTSDWVFVAIFGAFAVIFLIKGIVWVTRQVRRIITEYDNFWYGFSRLFLGNDR